MSKSAVSAHFRLVGAPTVGFMSGGQSDIRIGTEAHPVTFAIAWW